LGSSPGFHTVTVLWTPHHINYFHLGQRRTETGVGTIASVGQDHTLRTASLASTPNLLQGNLRLGLKLDLLGNASFLPSAAVLNPSLRQIQAESHRHTGRLGGHRKTDRHTAIILFANLAAILPGHSHRLLTLLRKSRVIHHPSHYWSLLQHRWQHRIQTSVQHYFIAPGGIGHNVVQRLLHTSHIVGSQTSGHRLDAFALAWQQ
jgi:hypothetical protein